MLNTSTYDSQEFSTNLEFIYIAGCVYCRIIGEKRLKNMEGKLPTLSLVQLVWLHLRLRESAVAHLN